MYVYIYIYIYIFVCLWVGISQLSAEGTCFLLEIIIREFPLQMSLFDKYRVPNKLSQCRLAEHPGFFDPQQRASLYPRTPNAPHARAPVVDPVAGPEKRVRRDLLRHAAAAVVLHITYMRNVLGWLETRLAQITLNYN